MECRIQFYDTDLQQFSWCKFDESSGETIESGISDSAELLGEICSDNAKTIVFFPQQYILLTSPQLPPGANKQQLNAIAYTIEELVAEDIEDCFFALAGQQPDQTVPVAVIERTILDDLMQLLAINHVNARFVIPQIYLCPWSDDDDVLASICRVEGGYLIRYGKHEGLYCQHNIVNQLLALLQQQKSSDQNRLLIYGDDVLSDFESDELKLERQASITLLAQPLNTKSCINLKQKDYQSSHQWLGLLKYWRWPMAAMVLLAVVFVASGLVDGWQKKQLYENIISQQKTLLNQYLPNLVVGDQPKKQLITALTDSRGSEGQAGFLELLHEYSTLKSGFNAVITNKILYQQSRLVVNLETRDLNSLESFRNGLEKSNFQAQIENVNINPDKTTGRLVMREQ